ncbi:hypothetical protein PNA2_1060 [Pyrococcus sp. NA2]|nr:hypothetical protein [Pyrococcus sp. NA2]AEC51976.1 hypothetical protein PNA2_1060 [Pyrococcus sp. NA2]
MLSDHGELVGEHGKIPHGTFLYDKLLRASSNDKVFSLWDVNVEKDVWAM